MRWIATLLAALALSSCSSAATPTGREPILRIAQSAEPRSLDPLLLTGAPAEEIGGLLYSYLLRVDDRGMLVPDLALRVPSIANGDISADGMTIVYRLRSGVRWHDGARFSAADVIATYRAVMDPRNPVPTRLGFDRIRTIEAPGPLTLRVHLRVPFAPFLTIFSSPRTIRFCPRMCSRQRPCSPPPHSITHRSVRVRIDSRAGSAATSSNSMRTPRILVGHRTSLDWTCTLSQAHKRSFNSCERASSMPRLRSTLLMPNNFVQTPN